MTIQEIISKAVEGGYKNAERVEIGMAGFLFYDAGVIFDRRTKNEIFLDPLFWQSLGKALGWGKGTMVGSNDDAGIYMEYGFEDGKTIPTWQFYWHFFIDHLAEGKSPESFFEQF